MTDVGKLTVNLIGDEDGDGIWTPAKSAAFTPVLRKPNHYQNRIQFFENWMASKLLRGNTYVLKEMDDRNVVHRMYILDPSRVTPLVAPDSSVFYELDADNLAGFGTQIQVPASAIIHDRGPAPYHPLCGFTPIMAAALPAWQSLKIQESSAKFFQNNSKPGGVLTAPHQISAETAKRIQEHWEANFAGEDNVGKVAVLGDGLTYEAMSVSANEAQLVAQLEWGDDRICSAFHVPAFMVGVGKPPGDQSVEHLISLYYSQCVQGHIEKIELCLDEGLALPDHYGVEFDVDGLFRMDGATKMKIATDGVKGGIFSPNEARKKYFNMPSVAGGDLPYLQQQNWSLEDLAKRREMGVTPKPMTAATPLDQPSEPSEPPETDEGAKALVEGFRAAFSDKRAA
jgi:HK97 family phage portal protein